VISIDRSCGTLSVDGRTLRMDSPEGFALLSEAWMDAAIRVNHPYTFTWLGRPVIQFADDLLRLQELIYRVQPDVIVETGVAHGGSLIFHASICKLLGRGRVVGIDIEIRPHNRAAIEAHPLASLITLIEGSSIDAAVVRAVFEEVRTEKQVLVVLDSNHTHQHVLAELEAYSPLVPRGSYIIAMDGSVMEAAAGSGRGAADWGHNNANTAVREFAQRHPGFRHVSPTFLFNESVLTQAFSGFAGGVLECVR
jgi:cephalosporin hydroxylase